MCPVLIFGLFPVKISEIVDFPKNSNGGDDQPAQPFSPKQRITDLFKGFARKISVPNAADDSGKNNVYSYNVPLEKELLEFAAQEAGTASVGTVLVLYTGGAIGMRNNSGVYEPVHHSLTQYLLQMPLFNDPKFSENSPRVKGYSSPEGMILPTCTPSTASVPLAIPLDSNCRRIVYRLIEYEELLDSSNCDMALWVNLAKDIERYFDDFDGFVILHGTDTLPFAASALSFILENLSKPVVMTGSELPISELRSDGRHNLLGALLFAGGVCDIPEVTVYNQNQLYRGNRVIKSTTTGLDAFVSPNAKILAEMKCDVKVYHERIWKMSEIKQRLRVHPDLCQNVAILRLFPSISVDAVRPFFRPPMKGVILQTYGAGNVPSNNEALLEVFREANEKYNIIMLNITQCWTGTVMGVYATGAILETLGVVSGCDMTTEAALMKLAYVLGKWEDPDTQRRMLAHNLRGEMTEPVVVARRQRLASPLIRSPSSIAGVASQAATVALGELLVTADATGLASNWARNLFRSIACSAAENDDVDMLKQLLRISGHLEYSDPGRLYPLHMAAGAGSYAACRVLLESGVNPNVVDSKGYTPLSFAVRGKNCTPGLIGLLRKYNCQLSAIDSFRAREANNAARLGRVQQLRLYKLAGLTLQELDPEGRSTLHTAVAYHRTDTVRFLVAPSKGASNPVLYEWADEGALEMGGAGVDVNQLTSYGTTALDEARRRNFIDIIQILEPITSRNDS